MRYSDWTNDAANAGLLGTSYGVSCTVMGLGAILAGWGVLRTRSWTGWRAWTPMVIGVAEFVMLTPGLFGGFVIARIVIGTWMLMFAALGWSLYAQAHALTPQSANSGVGAHASPASAQAAAAPETRRSATLQSLLPQGRSPIRRRPAAKTGHHER